MTNDNTKNKVNWKFSTLLKFLSNSQAKLLLWQWK